MSSELPRTPAAEPTSPALSPIAQRLLVGIRRMRYALALLIAALCFQAGALAVVTWGPSGQAAEFARAASPDQPPSRPPDATAASQADNREASEVAQPAAGAMAAPAATAEARTDPADRSQDAPRTSTGRVHGAEPIDRAAPAASVPKPSPAPARRPRTRATGSAAPPPAPVLIELQITSDPPGAMVIHRRTRYGMTPLSVFVPADQAFHCALSADGHKTTEATWRPGGDPERALHVILPAEESVR